MPSFDEVQKEFLTKWAEKEGASTQTIEEYKKIFVHFKGLLKYRGLSGDPSRLDDTIVMHFVGVLEEKGIARVEIEQINQVFLQFIQFARSQAAPEKLKKPEKEKAKPAKKKAKSGKPTVKLGLLVFLNLAWIGAVLFFLYATPNLSAGLRSPLTFVLVVSIVTLILGLYRLFVSKF